MGRSTMQYYLLLLTLLWVLIKGTKSLEDTSGKNIMYGREYYFLPNAYIHNVSGEGVISEYNKPNKTFYVRTTLTATKKNSGSTALGTPVQLLSSVKTDTKVGPDYNDDFYVQMGKQGLFWGLRRQGQDYLIVLTGVAHRSKFEIVGSNICPLGGPLFEPCPFPSIRTCSPNNSFCANVDFHTVKGVQYLKIYDHPTPGAAEGGIRIDLKPV